MAKKKHVSIFERLEETASDVANAISVAATGSEIGILELAAEDEFGRRPAQKRKVKPTQKKTKTTKKKTKKLKTKAKTKPKTKATTKPKNQEDKKADNEEEKESRGQKESRGAPQDGQKQASRKAPDALTAIGRRLNHRRLQCRRLFA